jgi:hypothetical protein
MRPEADDADDRHGHEPERPRQRDPPALAPALRPECEERQHQPRRQLHADARGKRRCGRPRASVDAGAQQQPTGQREHQHRVVVGAAQSQHQQHRIEPHECGRRRRRAARALRRARRQPDRREAAQRSQRFERPQAARDAQRHDRVAEQREQRSVWRVHEWPADERERGVAGGLRRDVRVRVQAVQRAHAREGDVAEDILGDQRRTERDDHVRQRHRRRQRAQRQPPRARQCQQVAAAHDEHQQLEVGARQVIAGAVQRARQPRRPRSGFDGNEQRRRLRRVELEHQQRCQRADHPQCTQRAERPRRRAQALALDSGGSAWQARCRPGGLHRGHCHDSLPVRRPRRPVSLHTRTLRGRFACGRLEAM